MSLSPVSFVGDLLIRTPEARILHEVRSMLDARGLNLAAFFEKSMFGVRSSLSTTKYDD